MHIRPAKILGFVLLSFISVFSQWQSNNPVMSYKADATGVDFTMKTGRLRLGVCSDSLIHVVYDPTDRISTRQSFVVVKKEWPPSKFELKDAGEEVVVSTARLQISVNKADGAINYKDSAGHALVTEANRTLVPVTVNGESTYRAESFVNVYGSAEGFYGLGQHQGGVWNYRGESIDISQENSNISIPFLVSSNGYGIFWDNTSRSRFNNRFANYLYISSEVADSIDYYFIYGPELDQVVAGYRQLTGGVPMFGRWAYGFWQCKNRYKSQDELLNVAHKYRELRIPVDNIVQDWFWWNRKGEHIFNNKYPDPKGMVDDLHRNNFHLMISVWPFFEPGSKEYDYMDKQGWFVDKFKYDKLPYHRAGMAVYDASNPEARKYYWNLMEKALFSIGVDAWWLDTVEPETEGQEENILLGHKIAAGSGDRFVNAYPLLTEEGVYKGQRNSSDTKRVFILGRSAFAGSQRAAVTAWSGDVNSDWLTFKRQIPAGLNYSLSGLPYWTTDIGGFVTGNPDDPAYRELFIRWFQFGAFSPIFRVHGTRTNDQNELWSYGEQAQKILVDFDRLRYELMPYIYSVAGKVTHDNYTMMRPLVMDFRSDVRAKNVGDQFMFGPAFMVAPVSDPGASSRTLYLPHGSWYDFWTGKSMRGEQAIDAAAPLERMPLLVRAGSIVPMGPDLQFASERAADPIELRIYRGEDGDFTLYEDENDNYDYEKGAYTTIALHWADSARMLTIGKQRGAFPGMLKKRQFHIVVVSDRHGVGIGQTGEPDKTVAYDGEAVEVKVP